MLPNKSPLSLFVKLKGPRPVGWSRFANKLKITLKIIKRTKNTNAEKITCEIGSTINRALFSGVKVETSSLGIKLSYILVFFIKNVFVDGVSKDAKTPAKTHLNMFRIEDKSPALYPPYAANKNTTTIATSKIILPPMQYAQ